MNRIAVIRDPIYKEHSCGPGHPESSERLIAIDRMLARFPLREQLRDLPARDATFEEIAGIHEKDYIRMLEGTRGRPYTMLDADTATNSRSYEAAVRAAGGGIGAAEAVLSGVASGAFAFIRPPGHHAEAARAMGFCLFNNVAIAADWALRVRGVKRILIVDWDVHHGNGTMHSFYETGQVLYFSIHQYPHYPGTGSIDEIGRGPGKGFTVNVPLPGGQGDADYLAVFGEILRPIALEYHPELILVSAGFDIHGNDPLADMRVSSEGFGLMTKALLEIAEECCPGRLAFLLEGGYDLTALSEGAASVLESLIRGEAGAHGIADILQGATREVMDSLRSVLSPFWKGMKKG
jgi:acetoin utilization deacetylase AcuC-like enzyme